LCLKAIKGIPIFEEIMIGIEKIKGIIEEDIIIIMKKEKKEILEEVVIEGVIM